MIPTASNYPNELDSDDNLFLVRDALRVTLAEDYNPGDQSIFVIADPIMDKFPDNGLITLTEQVSDTDKRAISFYYGSRTSVSFDELELLDEFEDYFKPKNITHVTRNVMAEDHNNLKDALIAIEKFAGKKGTIDSSPLGTTLEGRVNYLRKLVFTPRAWFKFNKTVGIIPLEVTFTNQSFRLGDDEVTFIFDFGDNTSISSISGISCLSCNSNISSISTIETISVTDVVPPDISNVLVQDLDGGTIVKTYDVVGKFSPKLTVINKYGQDTVIFPDAINARIAAPLEAKIEILQKSGQLINAGVVRAAVGSSVDMQILTGEDPDNPGYSYAGEILKNGTPVDPIKSYLWSLSDDLVHPQLPATRAMYSIGGIYDIKLRVDTKFGSYRITTYEDAIDIIELKNLWLWNYNNSNSISTNEFGLLSETFKSGKSSAPVYQDGNFLNGTPNEEQAKREFFRNTGFAKRGTTTSGNRGTAMLFWASGGPFGEPLINQNVRVTEYEGFADTYVSHPAIQNRPWNWAFLSSDTNAYFVFGQEPGGVTPNTNPAYQVKTTYNLSSQLSSSSNLTSSNYKNGANELQEHVSVFDTDGVPTNGYFAVYRTAWKGQSGYILRNSGVGTFFRLRSFYKTEPVLTDEFVNIKKIVDIEGQTKLEGQLVALSNGLFFFNNTGSISAYNDSSGVWEVGGPSTSSVSFRSVQDDTIEQYNDPANTLLAASDNDRIAYLSFDYSRSAFIKFNGQDLTFSTLMGRPVGNQFMMGLY